MVNKIILIGNVGKDPIIRHINENTPVASFTLATNEVYVDAQGNKQKNTDWHNIVAWRNLAQLAEKYIHKGSQIYVEGKLKSRTYTDKENQSRTIIEVVAEKIQLLGKKDSDDNSNNSITEQGNSNDVNINSELNSNVDGGDLPF